MQALGALMGVPLFVLLRTPVKHIKFKFQVLRVPVPTVCWYGQYLAECGKSGNVGVTCGGDFCR